MNQYTLPSHWSRINLLLSLFVVEQSLSFFSHLGVSLRQSLYSKVAICLRRPAERPNKKGTWGREGGRTGR